MDYLADRRAIACPRAEFKVQLVQYEKLIHGKTTVNVKDVTAKKKYVHKKRK